MDAIRINDHIRFNSNELDHLDEHLIDVENTINPRVRMRATGGSADPISGIRREIIGVYREGVEIASSVEAYPLLALLRESGEPVPPKIKIAKEEQGLEFHLIELVFSLTLPAAIWPDSAEFAVAFTAVPVGGEAGPRAVSFFPPEIRESLLKIETHAKVGLTGELRFVLTDEVAETIRLPKASVEAESLASLIAGPFQYDLRRARIEANGLNESRVQWRYNLASELAGSSEFQSWVVVKTAQHVERLGVSVELGVLPFRRQWLVFKEHLPVLRRSLNVAICL